MNFVMILIIQTLHSSLCKVILGYNYPDDIRNHYYCYCFKKQFQNPCKIKIILLLQSVLSRLKEVLITQPIQHVFFKKNCLTRFSLLNIYSNRTSFFILIFVRFLLKKYFQLLFFLTNSVRMQTTSYNITIKILTKNC